MTWGILLWQEMGKPRPPTRSVPRGEHRRRLLHDEVTLDTKINYRGRLVTFGPPHVDPETMAHLPRWRRAEREEPEHGRRE